jgi:hypothetical protein
MSRYDEHGCPAGVSLWRRCATVLVLVVFNAVGRVSIPDMASATCHPWNNAMRTRHIGIGVGVGIGIQSCFPCSCQRNRPYKGLPQIDHGFFLCGSGLHPRNPYYRRGGRGRYRRRILLCLQLPRESPLQRAPTDRLRFFSLWERIASAKSLSGGPGAVVKPRLQGLFDIRIFNRRSGFHTRHGPKADVEIGVGIGIGVRVQKIFI